MKTPSDLVELFYTDPEKALELHGEMVKRDIREEYNKAQGEAQFWNGFYHDHPDLRADHDAVRTILTKNLANLAPMTVEAAGNELADLTRQYIKNESRHRAEAREAAVFVGGPGLEGTSMQHSQSSDLVSLGDRINARKEARRVGQAKATDRYAQESKAASGKSRTA
jgi:hypothetical protein